MTGPLSAVSAAVETARDLGLRVDEPQIISDRSNLLVHLKPSAVVARVATMTALIREQPEVWLQREVEVAGYLASVGASVVPPTGLIPPGPYKRNSHVMTFWAWEPEAGDGRAEGDAAGSALAELHEAIAGYPGMLPLMGPILNDAPRMLTFLMRTDWLPSDLLDSAESALGESWSAVKLAGEPRPLHGDASLSNLFVTAGGLMWSDLEDACLGPAAWDLAVLARSAGPEGPDVLRAYGGGTTLDDIAPFVAARELQAALWAAVLADRSPSDRPDAKARLERSVRR